MKLGRLLLRATVGGFFIGHGTQKLFGWFGGEGPKGTAEMFESLGLKPGKTHATAAGVAETAGGAGLLLGFKTPFAASALIGVMLTAINRVHLRNGPWAHKGGYEYNAVLIASAVTLAELGPGKLSVDGLRNEEKKGLWWGLASLALGAIGAAGAHLLAESQSGIVSDEPLVTTEMPVVAEEAPTETGIAPEDVLYDESPTEIVSEGEPAAAETTD